MNFRRLNDPWAVNQTGLQHGAEGASEQRVSVEKPRLYGGWCGLIPRHAATSPPEAEGKRRGVAGPAHHANGETFSFVDHGHVRRLERQGVC